MDKRSDRRTRCPHCNMLTGRVQMYKFIPMNPAGPPRDELRANPNYPFCSSICHRKHNPSKPLLKKDRTKV